MSKLLTIGEIEEMSVEALEKMLSLEQKEKLAKMKITTKQFLDNLKDEATLSGLEEDDEFVSISQHIAHIQEMDKIANDYEPDEKTIEQQYQDTESVKETSLATQNTNNQLSGFSNDGFNGNISRPDILTNIQDKKMIFNLGKHVDKKLNDCVGQEIIIDKILIKKYVKPLDTPIYDVQTGEILADTKTSMSVVIVDKDGTSYATGSKTFGYALINAIYDFGNEIDGLKIRIIKTLRSGAQNQSLDFELV